MTEEEWLAGADPLPMLEFLRGRASDRKLRLFACACCRRVWRLLTDEDSREAVAVAERYADGQASALELAAATALAASGHREDSAAWAAYWAAKSKVAESIRNVSEAAVDAGARAAEQVARASGMDRASAWNAARAAGNRDQALLLREVFGNPFRPVSLDPSWLRWNNGTVGNMARTTYEERAFDNLPVLADALEEAGCSDPNILGHCRGGGEHVRGCWVLDLLLEKE